MYDVCLGSEFFFFPNSSTQSAVDDGQSAIIDLRPMVLLVLELVWAPSAVQFSHGGERENGGASFG